MARAAVRPVPPSLEDAFIARLSGKEATAMRTTSTGMVFVAMIATAGAGGAAASAGTQERRCG